MMTSNEKADWFTRVMYRVFLFQPWHSMVAMKTTAAGGRRSVAAVKTSHGTSCGVSTRISEENRHFNDREDIPMAPHVTQRREWVAIILAARRSLHLDHPWEHGRFTGGFGRSHGAPRSGGSWPFWFGGFYFSVLPMTLGSVRLALGCGRTSSSTMIDHIGWYLAYNVRLGT